MRRRTSRHGFTLIELLVVIAIIAILAAILFPVFARARENARRSSCQSNLKQVGLGLLQYIQDYDEVMPSDYYGYSGYGPSNTTSGGTGVSYKWMDAVDPYVKSTQLFTCPSDSGVSGTDWQIYKPRTSVNYGSYAINATYNSPGGKTPPVSQNQDINGFNYQTKISAINEPATTVWVCENGGADDRYHVVNNGFAADPISNTTPRVLMDASTAHGVYERHLDTTNVLWCDGHVKAVKLSFLNQRAASDSTILKYFTIEED